MDDKLDFGQNATWCQSRTLLIESIKIAKEYRKFFETLLFKISSHIARVEKKKEKKGAKLEPLGDGLITTSTSSSFQDAHLLGEYDLGV